MDTISSTTGGCDTLLTTILTINGAINTAANIDLCQGETYNFNGQIISTSGVYADTTVLSGGCDSIHTITIAVNSPIIITESYTICDGEAVIVNGLSISNATTIRYIKPNPSGCDTIVDATVNVIKVNADFTFTSDPINSLKFTFTANGNATNQYSWDFGDGNTSSQQNPIHTFLPGTYQVTLRVFGTNGCESKEVKLIAVSADGGDLFVPNVFTPNRDGVNDEFKLTFNTPFDIKILIFNRWGELLFESNDCYFEWNGEYKGADVQSGTYVYLISGKYNRKGTLTLLR